MKKTHLYRLTFMLLFFVFAGVTSCKKDAIDAEIPIDSSVAAHWQSGDVFYGENQWTEVGVGNMPLIISAPHGGSVRPNAIPDRGCPNITTVRDTYTLELARAIEQELVEQYNLRPYVVISHIARTKVDLNREIEEATCGNAVMKRAWHNYHDFVDTAVSTAAANHGRAIFIDLHGHGHENQRLELGYSLNINELGRIFSGVDLEALGQKSSLRNLLRLEPNLSFREQIMGEYAFGTLMENEGVRTVPSKQDPHPFANEAYFNGGYNTRYYTSDAYPNVFGWQIESHYQGVRDTAASRRAFARIFAKAIIQYLNQTTT